MKITIDLLKKHGACEQGLRYIERFFPNGAEVVEVIFARHISKEFLHWGREHLTLNAEEVAAYEQVCGIKNSGGCWYSTDVENSERVIHSARISNSTGVFRSSDVMMGRDIVESETIEESEQIFCSQMIEKSQKVFKSVNITNSINICNSSLTIASKNVIDSSSIFGSSEIVRGKNISDSHFCIDCSNIKHCLFCTNISDVEYHIFNQPVDKNYYEVFVKQYEKYMNDLLSFIRNWPSDLVTSTYEAPTKKYDDWYTSVSPKFWKWARTLPGYDEMLLYEMTMLPEILVD